MNIFALLAILVILGMAIAGFVLLIIAAIKKQWKLAALAVAGPLVGFAVMAGGAFVVIGFMDVRLKREVVNAEVIGTWVLREESLSAAKRDGYQPPVDADHGIDIRADGSCRYRSIRPYPPRFIAVDGSWNIRPAFGETKIYELSISTAENRGSMFSVSFTEEKGRLVLWEYFGDPDQGDYLKYDKQPNQPPKPTSGLRPAATHL